MKTREKILQTSLALFNEEGEAHVTTVDIANEIDISPGNLYYHFKGKEVIIENLYARFDQGFTEILQAPLNKTLKIEDSWFYLYVIFEEMYHYRFIYRNLDDILQRYESINKRFKRLLNLKYQTASSLLKSLRDEKILAVDDVALDVMVNNIVMTLTYWIAYAYLRDGKQPAERLMHKGVFQILSLIAPYLAEGREEYREFCQHFYQEALAGHLQIHPD